MTSDAGLDVQQLKSRAAACYQAGDLRGAHECLRRLLDLCAGDAEVLNDAGTVSCALGRMDQARSYYLRALRADPQYAPARQNLEMLCRAAGASLDAVLREAASARHSRRDISVVVPLNSRFDVFAYCLEALWNQTFGAERYEVLAVANGVGPQEMAELQRLIEAWQGRYGERLRLIEVEEASIALARNAGIRQAEGAVIMQINEDAVLSRTALEQHWAAHEEFGFNARCVLLGGRSFPAAYLRRFFNYLYEASWLYMPLHLSRPRFMGDYQWFVTCNLSCLAEAYERFGFYDPAFTWGSDTELGYRWQKAQCMNLYVDTSIQGYHLHELTFAGHRSNCLKRAPFQFHLRSGRWPCEATEKERQEARDALEAQELDVPAFEAELLRLETEWPGPDAFAGVTVMGKEAHTLRELNFLITPLLKSYRAHLFWAELLRLMARGRKEVVPVHAARDGVRQMAFGIGEDVADGA
jgi:tetratricopeptide (TPR) repeat protein